MRRKVRCDSKLRGLPEAQRVKVDAWLFEEGRTYEKVVEGCLREFGLRVSKSSVGRYYERVSADRFAEIQRQERMALEPELSPSEAYEVLLRRIGEIALEEMDQPLEEINHKVVVMLARVLLAARREKHMATRVWVERRKVENRMAWECLRHWRRTMRKQPHVSYLPMLVEREAPPLPGPLPHWVAEREKSSRPVLGDSTVNADCKSAVQQIENLHYHPAAGDAPRSNVDGGQQSARPTNKCDMDNAPIRMPNPGENTQKNTIGLQSGGNSTTNLPTKTVITINY